MFLKQSKPEMDYFERKKSLVIKENTLPHLEEKQPLSMQILLRCFTREKINNWDNSL